jgi:hypothetical protein
MSDTIDECGNIPPFQFDLTFPEFQLVERPLLLPLQVGLRLNFIEACLDSLEYVLQLLCL